MQRTCDPSLGGECVKRFGIGYDNYREFIEENLYYIDKTWLVRDLIEKGGKVILFTRPRRFGKTLALSMLQNFFELKERKKFAEMRDGIEEALRQIREKGYVEGILNDGYIGCRAYGICFCRKTCIVEKC